MIKYLILILLILAGLNVEAQKKKRNKVKRKYRKTEKVSVTQTPVFFRGKVRDANKNLLQGVHVQIPGLNRSVHTNAKGEFFFYRLLQGKTRVHFNLMGYQKKHIDYIMKPDQNFHNVTLDEDDHHYTPEISTTQKREQHVLDFPTSVQIIDSSLIKYTNMTAFSPFSDFSSGFGFHENGTLQPNFVFRGVENRVFQPGIQSRISTLFDDVPFNPAFIQTETFDIEKLEIVKGPQHARYGNNAELGAIHFISKKPENDFSGYVTAGGGNLGQKEFRGAINYPIWKDKLFARAAGIYKRHDGYITNLLGGKLNGKNTIGGRLSIRFLPAYNMKLNLILNYHNTENQGIGFSNVNYPDASGSRYLYNYQTSLNRSDSLGGNNKHFNITLKYQLFLNEHFYLTSVSSFHKLQGLNNWDADGTRADALYFNDERNSSQIYQEIRFNFSSNSKLNGFIGANFKLEKSDQLLGLRANETHLVNLFFDAFDLVDEDGVTYGFSTVPDNENYAPVSGKSLNTNHLENRLTAFNDMTTEAFLNIDYQYSKRVVLFGGIRAGYSWLKIENENTLGETESVFGAITGFSPGIFFQPNNTKSKKSNELNYNWHAGIQYFLNENANVFASYSRAKRPGLLHYNLTGELEESEREKLVNYEAGIKISILRKVYLSGTGFYQQFKNLQNPVLMADRETNEYSYNIHDFGNATNYGAEAKLKISLIKGLELFGNYTWLHSRMDEIEGDTLGISGNVLPMAPEHGFTAGFMASGNVTHDIKLFFTPWYAYKTDFYFDRANSDNLKQPAYGVLNMNGGVEFIKPGLTISFYGTNLLDEETKFISNIGNDGSLFGLQTVIPGSPKMFGTKLTWKLKSPEKRRRRR